MERRQGLLGYLAVGLGVLALVVALGGRFSGSEMGRGDRGRAWGRDAGPAVQAPAPPPAPAAVPPAPGNFGNEQQQGNSDQRQHIRGGERDERAWSGPGSFRRGHRGRFGLLGGILPLLAAFLLVGFGFRLFRGGGRRWGGGPGQGGLGQHGHGPWSNPQQGQPQAAQPQPAPAPSPAPHTGETRRFDA